MKLLEYCIYYKSGYKYQLQKRAGIEIGLKLLKPIETPFISYRGGFLYAEQGYAWDGPSGPTIDTKNFMRGSLFHDVLYQLMKEGILSWESQKLADNALKEICKIDGMSLIRRSYVWLAVSLFGKTWSKLHKDEILTAP